VATNGTRIVDGEPGLPPDWYLWRGAVTVNASAGVGYGSFTRVTTTDNACASVQTPIYFTGWPQGDLFSNNVHAPLLTGGEFSLAVTITNARQSPAYFWQIKNFGQRLCQRRLPLFFPWAT